MKTFAEFFRETTLLEFGEMRPEDISAVNLNWSGLGAYAEFQIAGNPYKVMFQRDWHPLTREIDLSGYKVMLLGPHGYQSSGIMGSSGQQAYRPMILAAMKLVQTAPKDHPAQFISWDPYEDKMDLVYMAMYNRFMKRDWVMMKPGLAVNRQALATMVSSMSDADAASVQQKLAGAEADIRSEIERLRDIQKQSAAMRRQGIIPAKQAGGKK